MDFKMSQTYNHVVQAYRGEMEAVYMYEAMARDMQSRGNEVVGAVFAKLSHEEHGHAGALQQYIPEEGFDFAVPADRMAVLQAMTCESKEALAEYAAGEKMAGEKVYPAWADIADSEGYADIAKTFRSLAKVEILHGLQLEEVLEQF